MLKLLTEEDEPMKWKTVMKKHAPEKVPPQFRKTPSADEEWRRLGRRLAIVIKDLDEDEYLIISEKKRNIFVQFSAQGSFGIRVEAVSAQFYREGVTLGREEKKMFRALGWRRPTYVKKPGMSEPPDGSCNYYVDTVDASPSDLAELAVRTFHSVYGTRHPWSLQYRAFGSDNYEIRFPTLGLKREPK